MKQQQSWRDYQAALKRGALRKRRFANIIRCIFVCLALLMVIYGLIVGAGTVLRYCKGQPSGHAGGGIPVFRSSRTMDKQRVKTILDGVFAANSSEKQFQVFAGDTGYTVTTTIDPPLQAYILKKLDPRTSRYIGIVATNPATGKILAMADHDETQSAGNICAQSRFPAASIFKIITAAAAVERFDFDEKKKFAFNGKKHTLYKSQLKDRNNKYTNWVSLKEAFAVSINPVFGKLGRNYLKKDILEQYGAEFGFNMPIAFELPLVDSRLVIDDDAYNWAEIASGFNRETVISPVHGALIAGTVANGGKLMEPFIIERIINDKGKTVYTGSATPVKQAISNDTARVMQELMGATIKSGTCRKTFRGYGRDRILSRLDMGGKTGSIDNKAHDVRLDWFVGYAREKSGPEAIGLSVFVAHEKYIGTRASQYAKMIFRHYFGDVFANREKGAEKIEDEKMRS